jgi:hypothetical protein
LRSSKELWKESLLLATAYALAVNTTKKHDAREEPTYLQDFVLTEEMVELIQRFQTMENKITIGLEIDGIWNLKPLLDVSGGLHSIYSV